MDIRFNCPRCGQHLAVEEKGAGMTVNCPSCHLSVEIPRNAVQPPPPPSPPAPRPANVAKQTPPTVIGKLVKCRDCGQAISLKATSCPACGAPVKQPNYAAAVVVLGIVAFVVIVVTMAVNNANSPPAAKNPVKTHVGLTASAVAITNLDEYAWPAMKVYLNGTPLDGYKAIYDRQVAPHERILIPLTDFAKRDGRRFNPVERKATQVLIWVEGHDAPMFSFD